MTRARVAAAKEAQAEREAEREAEAEKEAKKEAGRSTAERSAAWEATAVKADEAHEPAVAKGCGVTPIARADSGAVPASPFAASAAPSASPETLGKRPSSSLDPLDAAADVRKRIRPGPSGSEATWTQPSPPVTTAARTLPGLVGLSGGANPFARAVHTPQMPPSRPCASTAGGAAGGTTTRPFGTLPVAPAGGGSLARGGGTSRLGSGAALPQAGAKSKGSFLGAKRPGSFLKK